MIGRAYLYDLIVVGIVCGGIITFLGLSGGGPDPVRKVHAAQRPSLIGS